MSQDLKKFLSTSKNHRIPKKQKKLAEQVACDIYFGVLVNYDFLFFSGPMYNATSYMIPLINSSALNYALNPAPGEIHRIVNFKNEDHYNEDFPKLVKCCTPAVPLNQFPAKITNKIKNKIPFYRMLNQSTTLRTWNAIDVRTQAMPTPVHPKVKANFPKKGMYRYFVPFNAFGFFIIGGKGPQIIRLGKFHASARVYYFPVINLKLKQSINTPIELTHAINAVDLQEPYNKIKGGQIIKVPPFSIINKPKVIEISYLEGNLIDKDSGKLNILPPSKKRYPEVYKKFEGKYAIKL